MWIEEGRMLQKNPKGLPKGSAEGVTSVWEMKEM